MPPPPNERPCGLYDCFCCWHSICSPWIQRVAPGKDYVCIPAGADNRPAWSVLVGFVGDRGLRLHRFRVAPSGRVLGQSNGVLEIVHNDAADEDEDQKDDGNKSSTLTIGATADLSPDGRSLLVFCLQQRSSATSYEILQPPLALQVQLDLLNLNAAADQTICSPLPRLPLKPPMFCHPVSAFGHIWAPYLHLPLYSQTSSRLVMLRLDVGGSRWVEAAAVDVKYKMEPYPNNTGGFIFQGQAVVGQKILVSLRPSELFFCFDCSTCTWSAVTKKPGDMYIPIQGRGVYVEEDHAIYFFCGTTIFAYQPPYYDKDLQALVLNPPTRVDTVCPYGDEGSTILTHLAGRLMCSVWIGIDHYCSGDYFHMIISTFQVRYTRSAADRIEILHSTCGRLDMLPSKPIEPKPGFCFLQEYMDEHTDEDEDEDKDEDQDEDEDEYNNENAMPSLMQLPKGIKDPTSKRKKKKKVTCAVESSKMLDCCREFLYASKPLFRCYVLEEPAVQINKALYIVCEDGAHSTLYLTNIVNGRLNTCHDYPLEPCQTITTGDKVICHQPSPWHFICSGSKIHAVSPDTIYKFDLKSNSCSSLGPSRPTNFSLAMVLQVGDEIVAVTHNLGIFCYMSSTSSWKYYLTDIPCPPLVLARISGYVVLSADTFIVCDDETNTCLLFDLRVRKWRAVVFPTTSLSEFHGDQWSSDYRGSQPLNGRCVYVEGFIYSCTDGGLVANEICGDSDHVHLGDPICLKFSWRDNWESKRMCLEYAGKDIVTGAIVFCVVQGNAFTCPRGQDVYITVVQVKTKRTLGDKMMPVGIEHVDIATSFVPWGQEFICASSCFAVGS